MKKRLESDDVKPGDIASWKGMIGVVTEVVPVREGRNWPEDNTKYEYGSFLVSYWRTYHHMSIRYPKNAVKVFMLPGGDHTYSYPDTVLCFAENRITRRFLEKMDRSNDDEMSEMLGAEKKDARSRGCTHCGGDIHWWERVIYTVDMDNMDVRYKAEHRSCHYQDLYS
jgi:hypothetical protein